MLRKDQIARLHFVAVFLHESVQVVKQLSAQSRRALPATMGLEMTLR